MKQDFDHVRIEESLQELESVIGVFKELIESQRFGIMPLHQLQDARLELSSVYAKLGTGQKFEPAELEQQLRKAYDSLKAVATKSTDSQIREFAPGAESFIIELIMNVLYSFAEPSSKNKTLEPAHT